MDEIYVIKIVDFYDGFFVCNCFSNGGYFNFCIIVRIFDGFDVDLIGGIERYVFVVVEDGY